MNRRDYLRQHIYASAGLALSLGIIEFFEGCSTKNFTDLSLVGIEELEFLDDLAEIIIPQTDTIGAKAVGAAGKIMTYMEKNMESPIQLDFVKGLLFWKEEYNKKHKGPLNQRTEVEKVQLMDGIISANADSLQTPFFPMLKGFVMLAYFTSKEVAKNVLAYDPIPGGFDPCLQIGDNTRIWSI